MSQPRVVVKCQNTECEFYDEERAIPLQNLGQGVYGVPITVCQCNPEVDVPIVRRESLE